MTVRTAKPVRSQKVTDRAVTTAAQGLIAQPELGHVPLARRERLAGFRRMIVAPVRLGRRKTEPEPNARLAVQERTVAPSRGVAPTVLREGTKTVSALGPALFALQESTAALKQRAARAAPPESTSVTGEVTKTTTIA